MQYRRPTLRLCLAVLSALVILVVGSIAAYAWLFQQKEADLSRIDGNITALVQYFDAGKGTADEPYIIATPDQLYNFAWLQYLGYFNVESEETAGEYETVYFKLGDRAPDGVTTALYGSGYLRDTDNNTTGDTLDLSGYTLPPIGNTLYPFIGNFDGNGKTITHLTVSGKWAELSNKPANAREAEDMAQIVGFFGVVGVYEGSAEYTYDTAANRIDRVELTDLTVKTDNSKGALVGFAAGYVNGTLSGVTLSGENKISSTSPALSELTANLSDYSLVGYATEPYVSTLKATEIKQDAEVNYYELENTGSGNAWGGSIPMSDLYTRLLGIYDASSVSYPYISKQTIDPDGTVRNEYGTYTPSTNNQIFRSSTDSFGSYTFSHYENNGTISQNTKDYLYLDGRRELETTATLTTVESTERTQGYKLLSNGYYLNLDKTKANAIAAGTNEATATSWVLDKENRYLCTTDENGTYYYLGYIRSGSGTANAPYTYTVEASTEPKTWDIGDHTVSNVLQTRTNGTTATFNLYAAGGAWLLGTSTGANGYVISDGNGHYLNASYSGGTYSLTVGDRFDTATRWNCSAGTSVGTISATINNSTQYLSYTQSGGSWFRRYTLALNTTSRTWALSSDRLAVTIDGTAYYLRYNNGWSIDSAAGNAATIFLEDVAAMHTRIVGEMLNIPTTTTTTETAKYTTPDTYFPLTLSEDGTEISGKNTGYVISGSTYTNTGTTHTGTKSGDIRVSKYAMSSISNSLDSTNTYDGRKLDVIAGTIYNGQMTFSRVEDAYNKGNATMSNKLNTAIPSAYRNLSADTLGLTKYEASREKLEGIMSGKTQIYGLHFMTAAISKDDCVTVPQALINTGKYTDGTEREDGLPTEYTDYLMPRNCIDFNLKESGRINFFAGSYFPGNQSFFSLFKIERSDDGKRIEAIKKIEKVYEDAAFDSKNPHYVYKYEGEAEPQQHGSLLFDTTMIENPNDTGIRNRMNINTNQNGYQAVFYFEIPANAGEYALGSCSTDGAYLFYLDIAANAETIERTVTTETITQTTKSYIYPKGVDFAPDTTSTITEPPAATVTLPANAGAVSMERSGDVIAVSSANAGSTMIRSGVTLSNHISATASATEVQSTVRVTTSDYYTTQKKTEIRVVETDTNGTKTNTLTVTDAAGTTAEQPWTEMVVAARILNEAELMAKKDILVFHFDRPQTDPVIALTFRYDPSLGNRNVAAITAAETFDVFVTFVDSATPTDLNGTQISAGNRYRIAG